MEPIQQFFATTYTQADARRRISLLENAVEQAVYSPGSGKTVEAVVKDVSHNASDTEALVAFLAQAKIPKESAAVKKFLAALREEVLNRPAVTLSLPFEPSQDQINAYGEWFRTNVNPTVLLSILFDASVVGGCAITWQGKQVTYDLEYLIKQKRNEIVAVVDKFVEKKRKEVVV